MSTRYAIGRWMAMFAIGVGWLAALISVPVGISALAAHSALGAVILGGGAVGGLLNHALWQVALALFDIADDNRAMRLIMQDADTAAKRAAFDRKKTD